MFTVVADNSLSSQEKSTIKVCSTHSRDEHTARLAIRTIIWDLVMSNDKMRSYILGAPKEQKPPTPVSFHKSTDRMGQAGYNYSNLLHPYDIPNLITYGLTSELPYSIIGM